MQVVIKSRNYTDNICDSLTVVFAIKSLRAPVKVREFTAYNKKNISKHRNYHIAGIYIHNNK